MLNIFNLMAINRCCNLGAPYNPTLTELFSSQLFGYFQSGDDDQELSVGEDVSVFMVSARRRVGDAAGEHAQSTRY